MFFPGRTACAREILRPGVLRTPIGLMRGKAARRQEKAKAVAVLYGRARSLSSGRASRGPGGRTYDAKEPGPFGVAFWRAPTVSRRSTDGHRIALRAAPCGSRSPERNAGCFYL